jgi:hypothetical protein
MAKRALSPRFWKRALEVHGLSGVIRAGLRSLRPHGDDTEDTPYLDLTAVSDDPIETLYKGIEAGATPVISIPISSLRVESLGLRLDDLDNNPYTRTVAEYISGEHTTYSGSALERHLTSWQPKSLAEFLGLDPDHSSELLRSPLQAEILPWEVAVTYEDLVARRERAERSLALKFGPRSGGHGATTHGPVSEELGRYRFDKHRQVAESMGRDAGLKDRSDPTWWDPSRGGYVEAQLLVDESVAVGVVREGKHRTAALAALGVERMVVALPARYPMVHRSEAASWPGVRSEVFTLEQALGVFDRFFAGVAPWASIPGNPHQAR